MWKFQEAFITLKFTLFFTLWHSIIFLTICTDDLLYVKYLHLDTFYGESQKSQMEQAYYRVFSL